MTFDPERIETELAEIQKQSSPTEARTVILNVLVVSDETTRSRAERALGSVLGKRAARVIHIVETSRAESTISLSARCYLDAERRSVCFQEVLIENGTDGVGDAPGSWTPLLIRDIPVYVLWLSEHGPRGALLDHVEEQADKLIIDSEYAVSAGDTPAAIHEAVTGAMVPEGFRVSDLTWQRALPLRRATAHTFDPVDRARSLFELAEVALRGCPPMYGALYLAWIASRLGWKPAAEEPPGAAADRPAGAAAPDAAVRAYLDQQGRAVRTRHTEQADLAAGLTVRFSFFDREPIELSAEPDGCVSITGGDEAAGEVFNVPPDGEMLLAEIDAARNEALYIAAFDLIRR